MELELEDTLIILLKKIVILSFTGGLGLSMVFVCWIASIIGAFLSTYNEIAAKVITSSTIAIGFPFAGMSLFNFATDIRKQTEKQKAAHEKAMEDQKAAHEKAMEDQKAEHEKYKTWFQNEMQELLRFSNGPKDANEMSQKIQEIREERYRN